jgi:hypothetical protein
MSGAEPSEVTEDAADEVVSVRQRPTEITLVGWAGVIGGLAQLAYVVPPLLGAGTLGAAVSFESAQGGTLFGVAVSLVMAALALIAFGVATLRGSRRAWRIGLIVLAFNVAWYAMALISVQMVPAAAGLVASLALAARLCAADVRRGFGIEGDLKDALSSWV